MQEAERELDGSRCWQEPPGGKGLAPEDLPEAWPFLFTSQARFSVTCAQAQKGETQG